MWGTEWYDCDSDWESGCSAGVGVGGEHRGQLLLMFEADGREVASMEEWMEGR